jgi:hypothetical protein
LQLLDCKSSKQLSAIKAAGSAFEVRPAGRLSHHGYYVCAAPARHLGCAFDFREDGGSGDAGGLGTPFNDGLLRDVDFLQPLCIDQQVLRRQPQPADRALHSLDARPIDIDRVDLLDLDKRHAPTLCLCLDLVREFFASSCVELLRVVDPTIRVPGFRITAPAETGPARGLIPASSTPATA